MVYKSFFHSINLPIIITIVDYNYDFLYHRIHYEISLPSFFSSAVNYSPYNELPLNGHCYISLGEVNEKFVKKFQVFEEFYPIIGFISIHKRSRNFFTWPEIAIGISRFNCFKIDWYRCNSANQTIISKNQTKDR